MTSQEPQTHDDPQQSVPLQPPSIPFESKKNWSLETRDNWYGKIAALLGAVGVLCIPFLSQAPILLLMGFLLGIVALVLAIKGLRRAGSRTADNGGLSIVGIVLAVLAILPLIVIYAFLFMISPA